MKEAEENKLPDALELRESAKKLGLKHVDVLYKYCDEVLIAQYNGVGPNRWPEEVRDILSYLLKDDLESVEIHDMDYYQGGDEKAFHEANRVLGENTRTVAKKKYHWWNPRRWFLKEISYKLTEWTDKYGWEGWNKV